jgi:hypothetical protein
MCSPRSLHSVGSIEKNVSIDADVEAVPDGDLDCWLDIQVSPGDLRSEIGRLLPCSATGDLRGTRVGQ